MTVDLLHTITQSGWLLTAFLLVLIVPLLSRIVREVLRARVQLSEIRIREAKIKRVAVSERSRQAQDDRAGLPQNGPGSRDAGSIVDTNFEILEKYYEQTLGENRLLSRSAIGVALLGFFVILIGVSLAFSGYTSVGVVSSVAGLLAEAATLMFFNQLREQVRQVQDYHKKLVSTQYLMTSIALARNLTGERHETEVVKIINNLLFLSNELHGSKSDHLFSPAQLDGPPSPPPTPTVERFPARAPAA